MVRFTRRSDIFHRIPEIPCFAQAVHQSHHIERFGMGHFCTFRFPGGNRSRAGAHFVFIAADLHRARIDVGRVFPIDKELDLFCAYSKRMLSCASTSMSVLMQREAIWAMSSPNAMEARVSG